MTLYQVVWKIQEAMLSHQLVPARFDIVNREDHWKIKGELLSSIDESGRSWFEGEARPDGTFRISGGAFGRLTEEGLDVFANL